MSGSHSGEDVNVFWIAVPHGLTDRYLFKTPLYAPPPPRPLFPSSSLWLLCREFLIPASLGIVWLHLDSTLLSDPIKCHFLSVQTRPSSLPIRGLLIGPDCLIPLYQLAISSSISNAVKIIHFPTSLKF